MISNEKIVKKFKNLKMEEYDRFYGFWDFYNRSLTLRIFATATVLINKKRILTHVKEVIRFAPNGLRDQENWSDRKGKHHNGFVNGFLWENSLYFHTFTNRWSAVFSNEDNKTLAINLTKNGKPFNRFGNPRNYQPTNWNVYDHDYIISDKPNIFYTDITDQFQSKRAIDRFAKIKLRDGKTSAPILDLIPKNNDIYQLYNYIHLYRSYPGLKAIYDNKLYQHLNFKFLELLTSDKQYQKFYHNLISNDIELARNLNSTNFKKAFKGVDVQREKLVTIFKRTLTILSKNVTNEMTIEIINQVKKEARNLKWIDSYKTVSFFSDKVSHYIDYLVFKNDYRGALTTAIIHNKNWEREYDRFIEETKTLKALELQEKFEKENKQIGEVVTEIANYIGVNKLRIKNKKECNEYLIKLPHDLKDYNNQGHALVHCYKNSNHYLKEHSEMSRVLIFVEKNGVRYATATLQQNGTVTDFNIYKNEKVADYEKQKLGHIIKQEIYPKINELREGINA